MQRPARSGRVAVLAVDVRNRSCDVRNRSPGAAAPPGTSAARDRLSDPASIPTIWRAACPDLADMDVDVTHRRRVDRDHDMLDALRRGDRTAPDELMTRYRRRAIRLASGITGNHQDAEDVVQDAFWTVVRKIHAFRGDAAFASWLYRIVVNAAYQNRRRRRASRDEASLDDVGPGPVRDWPAAADDPALRAELRCALAAAMDELPAAARAVVLLREVEGRSNAEAAEALGLTAELVKGRAHRARQFLRRRLACRS